MQKAHLKFLKVLFVEDDEMQRQELSDYLKRRVGKIYFAKNGEEGLEKYKQCAPNIVICDIRMPKMDGLKMVSILRTWSSTIPIIMLTALSDKESILAAVDLGITNYLIKPVDLNKLEKHLDQAAKEIIKREDSMQNNLSGEGLDQLKRNLIKYIKAEMGKGPNEVNIKHNNHQMLITVFGAMTLMERNLMKNERNINMVNYLRNQLYSDNQMCFCKMVEETLNIAVKWVSCSTDCLLDETLLTLETQ